MKWNLRSRPLRCLVLTLTGLVASSSPVIAQERATVVAGGTVNITVTPGAPAAPPVSITLHERHGHVTPLKGKCTHTGGGLIDVTSPAPDTVVITMSGAVVSNSEMKFDLDQCFEVSFDDPKVKKAKLTVEGRVVGLLRGEPRGSADYSNACAHVGCGPVTMLSVCVPEHTVCGSENLAVNDHDGPKSLPVTPGTYTLNQTFAISARSDCFLLRRPSAEFAPDPALDPLWINYHEPFHGVKKDSFGFQVIVKVAPDSDAPKKELEALPAPTERKPAAPRQ